MTNTWLLCHTVCCGYQVYRFVVQKVVISFNVLSCCGITDGMRCCRERRRKMYSLSQQMGTPDNSRTKANRTSSPRHCFQQCVLEKLLSPLLLNYERLFLCHYISHLPQMCFIFHLWLDNLSVQIVTYIRRVDSGVLPYSPFSFSWWAKWHWSRLLSEFLQVSPDYRHSKLI